jgi:hypothetical protein
VSRHKMKECFSYERWVTNLWKGGGNFKKKKEKANIADEALIPEKTESANIVTESVSSELMKCIQVYILSDSDKQENSIIINSGTTVRATSRHLWESHKASGGSTKVS